MAYAGFGSSLSPGPSPASPGFSEQAQALQGTIPPQPQASTQTPQMPAARQLISEVAQVHSSLKGLATAYPEMQSFVDRAIQALKEGITSTVSGMQSEGSEGAQPLNA